MSQTAYRSALESLDGADEQLVTGEDPSPRYFVQFGWTVMGVDTNAVPGRYFLRGEIRPCVSWRQVMHIRDIPEGKLIEGTVAHDKDNKPVWGRIARLAGPDADRLVSNEQTAEVRQGLVELKSLYALSVADFKRIDFNDLFYPGGIGALPEKHEDVIAHLRGRKAELEKSLPERVPSFLRERILACADEMIDAAEYAHEVQTRRIEVTHLRMRLSPNEEGFKKEYDPRDEEMLKRTGKARLDTATDATAKALGLLSEKAAGGADAELVSLLRQQVENQNKLIEQLMRGSQPPAERPRQQQGQPRN